MSYCDEEIYDIIVIGGGPSGLFTAFYGGIRQCRVKIIKSMPQLGGLLAVFILKSKYTMWQDFLTCAHKN